MSLLNLTVKRGESVWVGDDVLVTVVAAASSDASASVLVEIEKNGKSRRVQAWSGSPTEIVSGVMLYVRGVRGRTTWLSFEAHHSVRIDRDKVRRSKESKRAQEFGAGVFW